MPSPRTARQKRRPRGFVIVVGLFALVLIVVLVTFVALAIRSTRLGDRGTPGQNPVINMPAMPEPPT